MEVGNTNVISGMEPEASGQMLERTKGESQNVPIWQSNEQYQAALKVHGGVWCVLTATVTKGKREHFLQNNSFLASK